MSEHQPALETVNERTFSRRQALAMGGGALAAAYFNGRVRDLRALLRRNVDLSRGPEVVPNINLDIEPINGSFDLIANLGWDETPGVERSTRGLMVTPLDMRVINKHLVTKDYVENPPINAADGYIRTNGNFGISTTVQSVGTTHVQLYGKLPVLKDDSRTEFARLDCQLTDRTLRVVRYDTGLLGGQIKEYHLQPTKNYQHTLDVQKIDDRLVFVVDGQRVGDMNEAGIFNNGNIWLGLNNLDGHSVVSDMTFRELGDKHQSSGFWRAGTIRVGPSQGETLQGLADASGLDLMMGSAVSLYPLLSDPQYAQIMLGGNFKILTIENLLKYINLVSMDGKIDPRHAKALMRIIKDHSILLNGHTPVYDRSTHKDFEQMPTDTMADKMRVYKRMEDYLVKFGELFGDDLYSCDVTNEALEGFGPKQLGFLRRFKQIPNSEYIGLRMRDNVFYRAMGDDWVVEAMLIAGQVMPKTKIGMLDYGQESDPLFRGRAMYGQADKIRQRGGRVDYIGFQMHDYIPEYFAYWAAFRTLIYEGYRRGETLRVSERDVSDELGELTQGDQYQMVLREIMRYPGLFDAHTFWGADDRYGSTTNNALLYDKNMREKYALRVVRNALRNPRAR